MNGFDMSRQNTSKNNPGTTKGDSNQVDEPSNCIICLENVSCRGKLSVCNHWFCFPCILEWSQNTNTCPICKARFRCITKVHLSPFKSPPSKVRIGDRDQRVWNDDDDLVTEDILAAVDSDDIDDSDDYEPPNHVANPWTMGRNRRRQRVRNGLPQTSTQVTILDEYDLHDSFIDDTDESQIRAFLGDATYIGEPVVVDDDDDNVNSDDGSKGSSESDEVHPTRNSPYRLRSSRTLRTRTVNNFRNAAAVHSRIEEQSCASPASTDSFIVSDDDSVDELNRDWVPFGNHKNSRNKVSQKSNTKKKASHSTKSSTNTRTRNRSSREEKPPTQQGRRASTRRSHQATSSTTSRSRLVEEGISSRGEESTSCSVSGWISMAEKRAKPQASTSFSSSQKRERALASNPTRKKQQRKGQMIPEDDEDEGSECEEECNSGSDCDAEALSSRIRGKRFKVGGNNQQQQETKSSRNVRSKAKIGKENNSIKESNRNSSRLKQQQNLPNASTSSAVHIQDDSGHSSHEDEDGFSCILPTPRPDKKRSILTRRQHRSPGNTFDNSEDDSKTKREVNRSVLPKHQPNNNNYICERTERNLPVRFSPLVKKKKAPRKRLMSLGSDSE